MLGVLDQEGSFEYYFAQPTRHSKVTQGLSKGTRPLLDLIPDLGCHSCGADFSDIQNARIIGLLLSCPKASFKVMEASTSISVEGLRSQEVWS